MPFVPISERGQVVTTGLNAQIKIGRAPDSLKEYDAKVVNKTMNFANQDITGTFSEGYENAETGPIRWDVTGDLNNHIDDPINLFDVDNRWYVEIVIDGFGTFTGYCRMNSLSSNATVNAGHVVSFNARSIVRRVLVDTTPTTIKPTFTPYDPG